MKKGFKLIVPSLLAIIVCVLLLAGSTFALFTSDVTKNIVVGSATVNMTAKYTEFKAYSVEATDNNTSDDYAGEATAYGVTSHYNYVEVSANSETAKTFANKGTATLTDENIIELVNVTPGDRITANLTVTNNSNVDIIYRVRLNAISDNGLLDGLTVKAGGETLTGVIKVGEWTPWTTEQTKVQNIALEVFLPVEAGNEYQTKQATLRFTIEAVQANAKTDTLLEQVNAYLATHDGNDDGKNDVNNTMYDAIQEVKGNTELAAFDATKYLWSPVIDQFYAPYTVEPGFESHFFKAYTRDDYLELNGDVKYGVYAISGGTATWPTSLTIDHSFDAGEVEFTSITYDRHEATTGKNSTISTHSANTSLTIDAPLDVVHHYGTAGSLTILAVANASYHEFGKAVFVEIKNGRIALESGAEVDHIHLSTSEVNNVTVFNDITVAKASNVDMPEFSRDPVEIPEGGKLVVALQSSTEEEADKDYVWLTAVGIYEQVVVSDQKENLEADGANNSYAANSTDQDKKDTAQQIANNITATVDDKEYTLTATPVIEDNVVTGWTYALESENVENITENVTVATVETVTTVSVAGEAKETTKENGVTAEAKAAAKAEIIEEAVIEEIEESDKYVARIGTTGYTSLQAAWNAGANKTIILLQDLTQNGFYAYGTYTLDLNGNTLTLRGHSAISGAFGTDGGGNGAHTNLTIINGTLNLSGAGYSKYGIFNYGTLTLQDLTINSACETVIYSIGQQWGTAGVTTLDNVTLNSTHSSGTAVAVYAYKGGWSGEIKPTAVIKDSTITGAYNSVMMYGVNTTVDSCNITATNNNALWISNSATGSGITGTITVKGNTTITAGSDYKRLSAESGHSIVVTEGTYNFNPASNNSKNYVADGYISIDNGNGTWSVLNPTYTICDDGKVYKNGVLQEYTYSALFGLVENDPLSGLASDGEIIYFTNGHYVFGGHFYTQPGVILIGQSRDGVVVSGHYADNVFTAEGDLTVMNMTLESAQGWNYSITPDIRNTSYSKDVALWDCNFVIKNVTFSNTSGEKYTGYDQYTSAVNVPGRGNVLIENCRFQYLGSAICGVSDLDGSKTTIKNCEFVDTKEAIGYVASDVLSSTVAEWLSLNTGLVAYDNTFGDPNDNNYSKGYIRNRTEPYGTCNNYLTAY